MSEHTSEIKGTGRVIAGQDAQFDRVFYRIAVVEERGRTSILEGTIAAEPSVLSALVDLGEAAIDLGSFGWFGFYLVDVNSGAIKLTGPIQTD